MQALHRARRQQIEDVNMSVVSAHQEGLAKEAQEQLTLIGPLYAVVILEQSCFTQPGMQSRPQQQDKLFFEALYKVYLYPRSALLSPSCIAWSRLAKALNDNLQQVFVGAACRQLLTSYRTHF